MVWLSTGKFEQLRAIAILYADKERARLARQRALRIVGPARFGKTAKAVKGDKP